MKKNESKSHLTAAAGNDAIKKLFPTPKHFCANTKQLLTRLGYRTVENYSIVALSFCVSFFHFFVYLSIENLPFTIQSRSDDKSDSKSCDITYNHKSLIVKRDNVNRIFISASDTLMEFFLHFYRSSFLL